MVAIGAPEGEVEPAVRPHARGVSIAAVNGPTSVVIAGDAPSVLAIAETFASRGVFTKRLVVSHAFHSPLMEPMLEEFQQVAESVHYRAPTLPLVSNLTGARSGPEIATAAYWVRHVREAVRFAAGVETLHAAGATAFVEIGPKPTLLGLVPAILANAEVLLLPSLRAGRPEVGGARVARRSLPEGTRSTRSGSSPRGIERCGAMSFRGWPSAPRRTRRRGSPSCSADRVRSGSVWAARCYSRSRRGAPRSSDDRAMRAFTTGSLVDRLRGDDAGWLEQSRFARPAIFALQVALVEALRARGLIFDAVVGHGLGGVAAAHVAGTLSLDDAARMLCAPAEPVLAEPALFAPAVVRLAGAHPTVFVEVDPHPVLAPLVEQILAEAGLRAPVVACAARNEAETFTLLGVVGQLFVAGCVLRESPELSAIAPRSWRSFPAKTPRALNAWALRLSEYLELHPEIPLRPVASTLAAARSAMEHRLALVVPTREALLEALKVAGRGETPIGATRGEVREPRAKLAWLFTGQGAQVAGMGRGLYEAWPAAREAFEEAFAALDPHLDRPLRDVMWAPAGSALAAQLDQTGATQPALFALEWALAASWRSWGVEPDLVAGHSIGEIAAACFAGVFSLADGARLVSARGRLARRCPPAARWSPSKRPSPRSSRPSDRTPRQCRSPRSTARRRWSSPGSKRRCCASPRASRAAGLAPSVLSYRTRFTPR